MATELKESHVHAIAGEVDTIDAKRRHVWLTAERAS
jgi:hypothetical protein